MEPLPKDSLRRLLDGLQTLIREHLALARVEAREELRMFGKDIALSAAGVPVILAGFLLLLVAVALLLANWMAAWAAFGLVALFSLGTGAMITFVWGRRASEDRPQLEQSGTELRRGRVLRRSRARVLHCPRAGEVSMGTVEKGVSQLPVQGMALFERGRTLSRKLGSGFGAWVEEHPGQVLLAGLGLGLAAGVLLV